MSASCPICSDLDASHCLCAVAVSGPRAFYNERDPFAAQWLRNLIAAGHIAPGVVDERSITEILPDDLRGFTQCHWFAGIGIWSHALRRAGWPDDVPVWTGSCPCQPFSAAGKQQRFDDDRHLWPAWFDLIRECRPAIVLGEQVASALDWLDLVSADLEGADYAFGSSDLCAAGFGGAHIRQRLYFVAMADPLRCGTGHDAREGLGEEAAPDGLDGGVQGQRLRAGIQGPSVGLAHSNGGNACAEREQRGREHGREPAHDMALELADAGREGRQQERADARGCGEGSCAQGMDERSGDGCDERRPDAPLLGRNPADWLFCRDGKWRPVEPGTFPLADAAPQRVGRLRAYGNALDAETAAQFCEAVAETLTGARQHAAVLASGAGEMTFHGEAR